MTTHEPLPLRKASTGIEGFDEMTRGGLPRGRTTLLLGGPGGGKTIFALQALVHGAVVAEEPGVFVCFEEPVAQARANAATLRWGVAETPEDRLAFVDATLPAVTSHVGGLDLEDGTTVLAAPGLNSAPT